MRPPTPAPEEAVESSAPLASATHDPPSGARPAGVLTAARARPVLRLLAGGAASPPPEQAYRLVTVTEPATRETPDGDDLVRGSQRGDRVAFAGLFRRHGGDVSRL